MKNMTALVSCFARAYHYINNNEWVFKDNIADCILTNEEYNEISSNMKNGISYFEPEYNGKKEDELQFVVNNFLAPAVLARAVFCEKMLGNAESFGCKSYAIFASGYDTYSLRKKSDGLKVFELELPEMIEDKLKRIQRNGLEVLSNTTYISCDLSKKTWKEQLISHGFNEKLPAFGSLLGISYYLTKLEFKLLIENISELWCDGSSICFDYPAYGEELENFKVEELANSAGEKMM